MLKKILRKILFKRDIVSSENDHITSLIKSGNIVVGRDSNLKNLSIYKYDLVDNLNNITIGDNCYLENGITLYSKNSRVTIGSRTYIGPNTNLNCYLNIVIGDDVMFSWGCTVMDTNAHCLTSSGRKNDVIDWLKGYEYKDWSNVESKKIVIGSKSWIGFNSIILKGVELGEGCIVAAGSVVTKSFPSYSVIGGNPAVFIKKAK